MMPSAGYRGRVFGNAVVFTFVVTNSELGDGTWEPPMSVAHVVDARYQGELLRTLALFRALRRRSPLCRGLLGLDEGELMSDDSPVGSDLLKRSTCWSEEFSGS